MSDTASPPALPLRLKAAAGVWDALVSTAVCAVLAVGICVQHPLRVPVPFAVVIVLCCVVLALAYLQRIDSAESMERWVKTGVFALDVEIGVVVIGAWVFAYFDQPAPRHVLPLAASAGLALLLLAWAVLLRPSRPWDEPTPRPLWWAMAVVSAVALGVIARAAPAAAIPQVAVYSLLWVSAGRESLLRPVVASAIVTVGGGVGMALSRGLAASLVIEIAALAVSLVVGLGLRSGWRWAVERDYLVSQLAEARASLAAAEREAGVVAERERLAREIHDTVAQSLVGVLLAAERARGRTAEAAVADDLTVVIDSARAALAEARAMVAVGAGLESADSLDEALTRLADRVTRETGIAVTVDLDLPAGLPPDRQLAALRTCQEGLANIRKHSQAAHAQISVRPAGRGLRVEVVDDGVGADEAQEGFGLPGLRERVAAAGGTMEWESGPNCGTVLTVTLPLAGGDPEGETP
jgi:signal transduction histidine kinase